MRDIPAYLASRSEDGLLPFRVQAEAAASSSLHLGDVEKIALENGLLPARYLRNRNMISTEQQLALLQSRVAVFGCGGLGGYIIEELARLGVGHLVVVDPDVFEEHNLNRQLFSSMSLLGEKKVNAALRRVAEINPAVRVRAIDAEVTEENGPAILEKVTVAADGLDSVPARRTLAGLCARLAIPLVHGAIAGWYGHVASQFPGEETLEMLYARKQDKGIETTLGNPSFTPAVIAGLQVAEIVKIVLQTGENVRKRLFAVDLFHMEVNTFPLAGDDE